MGQASENLKDFCRRYGLTSTQDDKTAVITQRGYGAIGAFAIFLVILSFFIFRSSNSEIVNYDHPHASGRGGYVRMLDTGFGRMFVQSSPEITSFVNGGRIAVVTTYINSHPSQLPSTCQSQSCKRSTELKMEIQCDARRLRMVHYREYSGYHMSGNMINERKSGDFDRVDAQDRRIMLVFNHACNS
jgi:hypothetical protein